MLYLLCVVFIIVFFFFKQKTAYELRISDWSSDVCSSDLIGHDPSPRRRCRKTPAERARARFPRGTGTRPQRAGRLWRRTIADDAQRRDRKRVVEGNRGSVPGDFGGARRIKTNI